MNHSYRCLRSPAARSAGFSLIEMLTTMSVLVVLLVIASPGLASLTSANAASAAQGELVAAMTLARGEAIKRGVQVGIAAATAPFGGGGGVTVLSVSGGGTDFSGGWTVFVDADGNGRFDAGETIVRQQPAFNSNVAVTTPGPGAIVFNGRGFLVPSTRVTVNVCSRSATKGYQVRVEPMGLADVAETAGCV